MLNNFVLLALALTNAPLPEAGTPLISLSTCLLNQCGGTDLGVFTLYCDYIGCTFAGFPDNDCTRFINGGNFDAAQCQCANNSTIPALTTVPFVCAVACPIACATCEYGGFLGLGHDSDCSKDNPNGLTHCECGLPTYQLGK